MRGYALCRFSALIDNGILLKLVSMRLNSVKISDRLNNVNDDGILSCYLHIGYGDALLPTGMRSLAFHVQRVEESCGKIKVSDADAILGHIQRSEDSQGGCMMEKL